MKERSITKYYDHVAKRHHMDDTRFNIDLRMGRHSVSANIKIEGHGGHGELKGLTIENLRTLRDKITQLLEDFSWEEYEKIRTAKH